MTEPATAVGLAPLVTLVAPYVVSLASVVIPALVGLGLVELRKLTGLKIQQGAADKLDAMIEDEIGALVASASDNLATTSVKAGSPLVASIANAIIAAAPDLLAKAGVDPTSVAGMAHGEIGKWQAAMTRIAPGPPTRAAT